MMEMRIGKAAEGRGFDKIRVGMLRGGWTAGGGFSPRRLVDGARGL
jgi:hypothetical protein